MRLRRADAARAFCQRHVVLFQPPREEILCAAVQDRVEGVVPPLVQLCKFMPVQSECNRIHVKIEGELRMVMWMTEYVEKTDEEQSKRTLKTKDHTAFESWSHEVLARGLCLAHDLKLNVPALPAVHGVEEADAEGVPLCDSYEAVAFFEAPEGEDQHVGRGLAAALLARQHTSCASLHALGVAKESRVDGGSEVECR